MSPFPRQPDPWGDMGHARNVPAGVMTRGGIRRMVPCPRGRGPYHTERDHDEPSVRLCPRGRAGPGRGRRRRCRGRSPGQPQGGARRPSSRPGRWPSARRASSSWATPQAATLYAIDTGDRDATAGKGKPSVAGLGEKLASLLGIDAKDILIKGHGGQPGQRQHLPVGGARQGAEGSRRHPEGDARGQDQRAGPEEGQMRQRRDQQRPRGQQAPGGDHAHRLRQGPRAGGRAVQRGVSPAGCARSLSRSTRPTRGRASRSSTGHTGSSRRARRSASSRPTRSATSENVLAAYTLHAVGQDARCPA